MTAEALSLGLTGQQAVDQAARAHGWLAVGGDDGALVYRRPGTPAWVSITYAHTGAILWADGQDSRRTSRHFAGIDKVDRLVSFLAGG